MFLGHFTTQSQEACEKKGICPKKGQKKMGNNNVDTSTNM
jgi:hypothetical protein